MTTPDELLRLAERVEQGSQDPNIERSIDTLVVSESSPDDIPSWLRQQPRYLTSLDAVEALRERLLPGSFLIVQHETPTQWRVALHMEDVRWEQVTAPTEARARLAALLRAVAGKEA